MATLTYFPTIFYDLLTVVVFFLILHFIIKVLAEANAKKKEVEKLQYKKSQVIKLHMVSETEWVTQGQGVHTAFIELMELLADESQIITHVNEHGEGTIFHSHTYGPYYFWKGLKYKGRRILTAHVIPDSSRGTLPYWKQLLPLTTRYLKLVYSFADIIIAISPAVENEIKKLGVKSQIVRIYNPVLNENWARTPTNRNKGRQHLGIKDDELLILGVGQLQERKGVEDFIDMAIAMPEYKFVWVGGRPWGKFTEGVKRIDERIKNAPSNVSFAGLMDLKDMPPMYAAADLFLFPSYQENCPLAPLEAAASGLPVIFRDIPEYDSLYSTHYLKAATTPEFVNITRKLLTDPELYEESVELSKKLTREFDKHKIKKQLIDLYRNTTDKYFQN
jgi:1,2-diacylglycerol-3-alpha-glucose alpha-1,2-galactosyltransferase